MVDKFILTQQWCICVTLPVHKTTVELIVKIYPLSHLNKILNMAGNIALFYLINLIIVWEFYAHKSKFISNKPNCCHSIKCQTHLLRLKNSFHYFFPFFLYHNPIIIICTLLAVYLLYLIQ